MSVNNDGIWEIKRKRGSIKWQLTTLAMTLAGLLICRNYAESNNSFNLDDLKMISAGVVMLLLGVLGLIGFNIQRTVTILEEKQLLLISSESKFKKKERAVYFSEIESICLDEYHVRDELYIYDIVLKLKNGKKISPFRGYSFDKTEWESHFHRLQQILNL